MKLLLKSKLRGKAVRIQQLYSLALSEISRTLGEPAPPNASLSDEAQPLQEHIPKAEVILRNPENSDFSIDHPIQAMRLLASSLKTGIERNFTVSAQTLLLLHELNTVPTFSRAQKEKIIELAAASYLVGLLAPVAQFDLFSRKLDDLLLETRRETREELLKELREEKLKNDSLGKALQNIEVQQRKKSQPAGLKPELTTGQKVAIINDSFRELKDIGLKFSYGARTIRYWDGGNCPYNGYSSVFSAVQLKAWCFKIVAELRLKKQVTSSVGGMSDDEMSRKALRH